MSEGAQGRSIAPASPGAGGVRREDRVFARATSPASDPGRAVVQLLAPFRAKAFSLGPPLRDIERHVTAALALAGTRHSRTCVIPVGRLKEDYAALPYSMREAAKAGLRNSLAEAMAVPLKVILARATGWKPETEVVAKSVSKDGLFDRLPDQVDDAVGGFVPATLLDTLTVTLTFHVLALAQSNLDRVRQVAPFTELFRAGNVPLGVLQHDRSFVVVTL